MDRFTLSAFIGMTSSQLEEHVLEAFERVRPLLKAGWPLKGSGASSDEHALLERLYQEHPDLYAAFRKGEFNAFVRDVA